MHTTRNAKPGFIPTPWPATRGVGTDSKMKAHLIFSVGSGNYACPIEHIEHVLRRADSLVQPTALDAPAWEAGRLITADGNLPIISLRDFWKLPAGNRGSADNEALLVIRLRDQSFVLLVESCMTVISSLPPGTVKFQLPAELLGTRGAAFEDVIYWQQSLLVTVQLERLLTPDFEHLLMTQPIEARRI